MILHARRITNALVWRQYPVRNTWKYQCASVIVNTTCISLFIARSGKNHHKKRYVQRHCTFCFVQEKQSESCIWTIYVGVYLRRTRRVWFAMRILVRKLSYVTLSITPTCMSICFQRKDYKQICKKHVVGVTIVSSNVTSRPIMIYNLTERCSWS